jgi:hypothetical protein
MARVRHIVKRFDFVEENRPRLTFGTGTRLDKNAGVKLIRTDGAYSEAPDLFVKTWTTRPRSLKRWTGFMVDEAHPRDDLRAPITAARYRLCNSTQELYWNPGAAQWVAASSNNWNTEAEVSEHIAAFPVLDQTLGIVVNLSTTDSDYTPVVTSIRVLAETDLDELQDYIWESLLPAMENNLRPIGEFDFLSAGDATVGLGIEGGAVTIETPYNIVGVDSVYNLTADPNRLTDLLSSYNPTTKVVTLSAAQPAGNRIRVRFLFKLPVAVNTHQDFIEIEKVPNIVFESIDGAGFTEALKRAEYVIDKTTGQGKQIDVSQSDIELSGVVNTDKSKDLARIVKELRRWADVGLLTSVGQDEPYRLQLMGDFNLQGFPTQQEQRSSRFRLRISNALFYDGDAVDITGTLNFAVTVRPSTCQCG